MQEIWKDIPGYEGLYQVSNQGRVKAIEHIDRAGKKRKEKYLKPSKSIDGYYRVALSKEGIRHTKLVARIEYEAFYGPIPEGMQVNHINEIKTDNRLENLNLMTAKENNNWGTRIERASKTNSIVMKNRKDQSKPVKQYNLDGVYIATYPSIIEAERQTGVKRQTIGFCCRRKICKDGKGCFYIAKSAGGYLWSYE